MKKNVMMRLASFLLVAVLISTSAISGTYAKYVTTASGEETARVAKWGVEVYVNALGDEVNGLFAKTYAKDSTTTIDTTVSATDKVVAPGTKNENGITFSITGTPEVAVKLDVQIADGANRDVYLADGTYLDWTTGNDNTDTFVLATPNGSYRPLVYTLKNDKGEVKATGTLENIETYLEGTLSQEIAPNVDLATIAGGTTGTYTLTWAWDYEQAANVNLYDKADTLLGNLAAGIDTSTYAGTAAYNLGVNVEISITATQIN